MNLVESLIARFAPLDCVCCSAEGCVVCDACLQTMVSIHTMNLPDLERVRYCSVYKSEVRQIVRLLKFERMRSAAEHIATALSRLDVPPHSLLVPVVTAPQRVRQRGYDQAVLITKSLAKLRGLEMVNVLLRQSSVRQLGAGRAQRLAQSQHLYTVRWPKRVVGRHIVLVDDVITTGATLRAAASALLTAGAQSVEALVFARAE